MQQALKIYIDRLSHERTEEIQETISPDFIDVTEKELRFEAPIQVKGKAYLAEDHLVLQLALSASAMLPCSICNQMIEKKIRLPSFYHTEEVENIRGQVYDYGKLIKEAILLEIPPFIECIPTCPKRDELKNYFSKGDQQFPFADLN